MFLLIDIGVFNIFCWLLYKFGKLIFVFIYELYCNEGGKRINYYLFLCVYSLIYLWNILSIFGWDEERFVMCEDFVFV